MTDNPDAYQMVIVHLQRATGRKAQVRDLISKAPCDVQIIDAVDGAKLTTAEIDACYSVKPLLKPAYPFKLNAGEIGCFLSHRNIWQEIVDQNLEAGLIVEDDVHIDMDVFSDSLALAFKSVQKLGFIQFQVREISDKNVVMEQKGSVQIIRPVVTPLRTSAQVVNRATALELLELTQRFDRPVDGFLQLYWETQIHICCVIPSGVSDRTAAAGGSTLSIKQPIAKKLEREAKRFRYKAQIKNYSKRTVRTL